METSSLLRVLVGSTHFPSDDVTPTLVVEAEADRLEAFRQKCALLGSLDPFSFHQAVLTATAQENLVWFRFSDSRFNGIVPLERWQKFYPNLQLQQDEALQSQTLGDLLARWPAAQNNQQGITLSISQGDPVAVLKGAEAWLHRIHRIELQGPKAEALWLEDCGSWLEQQGFQRESTLSLSWVLDRQILQLIKQRAEIENLRKQLSTTMPQQQREIEEGNIRYQQIMKAFGLVFPYAAYREKRPDLNHLDDSDLISHYILHGIHEDVNLQFSELQNEWEQNAIECQQVSFLTLLASDSDVSEQGLRHDDVKPEIPILSPLEHTGIKAWLIGGNLYVAFPDELAKNIVPAIYKGNRGFPLHQTEWSEAILNQLSNKKTIHLFSQQYRHNMRVLSGIQDPHVLDTGINMIPYCSVAGGQTLHIQLSATEHGLDLVLLEDVEVHCSDNETWSFDALIAMHRAKGNLDVITNHNGKSKISSIEFDPGKTGGTAAVDYLRVTLGLPLEKGCTRLTLRIRHERLVSNIQDRNDSYYFVANPTLYSCRSAESLPQKPEPRLLAFEQDSNTADVLFKSSLSPFFSSEDQSIVLSLGNGKYYELFSPLVNVVTLKTDYFHTFILGAERGGDFALFVNQTFCQLISIHGDSTPVRLPLQWLRGEPVLVEIRDPSGSQIFLRHPVLAPRFLTPTDLLLQESKPPFPTDLTTRANHRYQSLRNHLRLPIEGLKTEMLIRALQTLDRDYKTLKLIPLEFPVITDPEVSVIIPAHNKVEVTFYALCALLLAHNTVRFEVVLVDDGSTDETAEIENLVSGIRVIHNDQPLRFIKACNKGVSEARGKFVVLLNNDTEVTVGWLDALVDAFNRFENVGAVGAKLLYPDGRLQDAGGIIWGSGNPWNYGNGQNPWDPRFCYARQVDYLSGAALMTTKAIWDEVGGLSNYLEPMYFEDTDFSFKVRDAGYKTYFIPSSIVYHFEGTTSGTDTSKGFKKYQEINRPKFKRCWAKAFAQHGEEGIRPDLEKDRGLSGRVLFIDYTTPRQDRDAGSYATVREMELVQSLGYKVTFLPQNLCHFGTYTDELQRNGIEVITAPFYLSLATFFSERAKEFDAVYITRYYVAADTVHLIRQYSPRSKILLNNCDLHFLRELRAALVDNDPGKMETMRNVRYQELEMMRSVDLVLSYNEVEHAVIASHTDGQVKVMTCPWVVDTPEQIAPLSGRRGLSFLGSFNHSPNSEGIQWFCRDIMPMLEAEQLTLSIYGSGLNQTIKDLAGDWVKPVGYVDDVADAFQQHRVFVAPLLSGAGMKGKVLNALAYGIPVVLTPIAAEGIGLRHGYDCMIARKPSEWVSAITQICKNDDLWNAMSVAARKYVASHFSFEAGQKKMKETFEAIDLYSHLGD